MLIAAIVVIALLAAVAVFSALKSRDADGAVGILSRETKSRDRESTVLGDEDALTGKQVERAQVLERKAASKELVLATSEVGRDPVHSTRYGRQRKAYIPKCAKVQFCFSNPETTTTCVVPMGEQSLGTITSEKHTPEQPH